MSTVNFTLQYSGSASDEHEIDFYDVSQALIGFQRSIALTTHLVLNNEVITQAPSLKGAKIYASPPEEGSWKITAAVIVGIYTIGTAPKDTPIGHLVASAYDYVVSETLGFHVDYDSTLGQQYEELKSKGEVDVLDLSEGRFDSVIEKTEVAIRDMHRPIIKSETALKASIHSKVGRMTSRVRQDLNKDTYLHVAYTREVDQEENFLGMISSYNINTYKGRIYLPTEKRPVPFELADVARNVSNVALIARSLMANASDRMSEQSTIVFSAYRRVSKSGKLKGLYVLSVSNVPTEEPY